MTPVLFHFITPDGVPLANARVDIQLSRSSYDEDHDGVLMPRLVEATTDEDGKVTVELAPADVLYHVECWDTDSEAGLSYKFLVPEQEVPNTPIRLQDIVIVGEMSNTSYDEAALIAIHAAKATALTAAISATASAAAADASADIAAAAVDEINGHMADPTGAHAASAISNTPAGGISATTVQAAINELDTEKARLDGAAFTGAVSAPGFTGPLTGNVTGNVSGSAPAGSLAGTTLAANVVNASLSSITPAGVTLAVNGSVGVIGGSYVAPSNGQAYFYASSALGLVAHGKGSSSDITLLNGDGTEVARVPTGTTNLLIGQTTNPSSYKLAVNGNVGIGGTLLSFSPALGNAPYIQHSAPTLDFKGGTAGVRVLNNAGSVVIFTVSDVGNVGVTGIQTITANSASPALTLVQSGAGRALLTTGSIEAGSFVGALIGNVTGNVSGSAGSVAAANLTGTTLASGVTAASLNSITPGGDLLDVIGHVIRVGRYGPGTGGNVRFVNDDGVQHWLAGMLGSVGYRRYSIYDIPNAREILGIDATSGQVQLGYGLGVTGAVAASTRFNLPAFTIATLPAAGAAAGLIYVADEAGGAVPAFSDGTNWRRVTDRAVVS